MKQETSLMNKLEMVDSYGMNYADEQIARAPVMSNRGTPTDLRNAAGNPLFTAQFDLNFVTRYYTLTGGAYTSIAPAALAAALQNSLPFFVFGVNDFAAGFNFLRGQYPINQNWAYGSPFIWTGQATELGLDATVFADLQIGDLVIPFTSPLPGAGTTTLALNIVRSSNVAYGTILDSSNSDRFIMNGIRYVIDDLTQLLQFSNQIGLFDLSLFGKADSDRVSPNSFKKPEQFQNGIIDIPIEYAIDKHKSMAFYNLYTNLNQSWSVFVSALMKIEA